MNFKNERISNEEKKKYGIDQIESKGNHFFPSWLIDEKRNVKFLRTGQNQERRTKFWLFTSTQPIEIHAIETVGDNDYQALYTISSIKIPNAVPESIDAILDVTKSALDSKLTHEKSTNVIKLNGNVKIERDGE